MARGGGVVVVGLTRAPNRSKGSSWDGSALLFGGGGACAGGRDGVAGAPSGGGGGICAGGRVEAAVDPEGGGGVSCAGGRDGTVEAPGGGGGGIRAGGRDRAAVNRVGGGRACLGGSGEAASACGGGGARRLVGSARNDSASYLRLVNCFSDCHSFLFTYALRKQRRHHDQPIWIKSRTTTIANPAAATANGAMPKKRRLSRWLAPTPMHARGGSGDEREMMELR